MRGVHVLEALVVGDSRLADESVELDLTLTCRGNKVVVSGGVRARWMLICRRCLEPLDYEVEVSVAETFETSPAEGETFPLKDGKIDLSPMLSQAIILELPVAPLCGEACTGPAGGGNWSLSPERGEKDCGRDERWAALDALLSGRTAENSKVSS